MFGDMHAIGKIKKEEEERKGPGMPVSQVLNSISV
jgi:hypothetical protein